jgi:imidazolonepropionase-like amidohydrolase
LRMKALFAKSFAVAFLGMLGGILPVASLVHGQADARVAMVGATVIDGTGAPARGPAVVVIDAGRIVAVGPAASVPIPRGTMTIDARDTWIVPGLIDVHAHFFESGRAYMRPAQWDLTALVPYDQEVKWTTARAPVTLRNYLCAGVTTVASMGGPRFEREVRERSRSTAGANVIVAHGPVAVPASPRMALMFPPFDGDSPMRTVATAREARAEVDRAVEARADLLKTGYLGGGVFPPRETELFWAEVLPALVSRSVERKLPVVAHVETLNDAKRFVTAGVNRLAHTFADAPPDAEFLEMVKTRDVMMATTMLALARAVEAVTGTVQLDGVERQCGDAEVVESWSKLPTSRPPDAVIQGMRAARDQMQKNVRLLLDAGVTVAVGSDAAASPGLLHGASFHRELKMMADAGIPPAAVIVSATRNGARFLGQTDVGTIEVGKRADLLVLDRDPTIDVGNLGAIRSVVKSGRVIDARTLRP